MKKYSILIYIPIFILFLFTGCSGSNNNETATDNFPLRYAKGFTVNITDNYTHIRTRDPWDTTKILQSIVLVDKSKEFPKDLPKGVIVRIPVEKTVAFNSPQCNLLSYLNVEKTISGVCEPQYITLPHVVEGLKKGEIENLGMASSPDIEKIIELSPELILVPAFQNNSYARLAKTGIPLFQCAEYMEPTPLGCSEWIRLQALFFNELEKADSVFSEIEKSYNDLKYLASQSSFKPRLLTETKYNNVWYMPGNNSFAAALYKDAGAELAINDNSSSGSIALAAEEVLERAYDADIWLIKYYNASPLTYNGLKGESLIYSKFKAWEDKRIFGCNTSVSPYYETIPMQPHIILKDLVRVFHPDIADKHPELFSSDSQRFFFSLED